jgi:hypothetical protein
MWKKSKTQSKPDALSPKEKPVTYLSASFFYDSFSEKQQRKANRPPMHRSKLHTQDN